MSNTPLVTNRDIKNNDYISQLLSAYTGREEELLLQLQQRLEKREGKLNQNNQEEEEEEEIDEYILEDDILEDKFIEANASNDDATEEDLYNNMNKSATSLSISLELSPTDPLTSPREYQIPLNQTNSNNENNSNNNNENNNQNENNSNNENNTNEQINNNNNNSPTNIINIESIKRGIEESIGFASQVHRQEWEEAWLASIPLSIYIKRWENKNIIFQSAGFKLGRRVIGFIQRWIRRYFVLVPPFLYIFENNSRDVDNYNDNNNNYNNSYYYGSNSGSFMSRRGPIMDKCRGAIYLHKAKVEKKTINNKLSIMITPVTQEMPSQLGPEEFVSFIMRVDSARMLDVWFLALEKISLAPLSTLLTNSVVKEPITSELSISSTSNFINNNNNNNNNNNTMIPSILEEENRNSILRPRSTSYMLSISNTQQTSSVNSNINLQTSQVLKETIKEIKEEKKEEQEEKKQIEKKKKKNFSNKQPQQQEKNQAKQNETEKHEGFNNLNISNPIIEDRHTIIEQYRQQLQSLTLNASTVKSRLRRIAEKKNKYHLGELLLNFILNNFEDASGLWKLMDEVEELPDATLLTSIVNLSENVELENQQQKQQLSIDSNSPQNSFIVNNNNNNTNDDNNNNNNNNISRSVNSSVGENIPLYITPIPVERHITSPPEEINNNNNKEKRKEKKKYKNESPKYKKEKPRNDRSDFLFTNPRSVIKISLDDDDDDDNENNNKSNNNESNNNNNNNNNNNSDSSAWQLRMRRIRERQRVVNSILNELPS